MSTVTCVCAVCSMSRPEGRGQHPAPLGAPIHTSCSVLHIPSNVLLVKGVDPAAGCAVHPPTEIASDELKGRVFEVNLGDLKDNNEGYTKVKLICEEVQGKNVLTNFYGMSFTRDKISSLIRKCVPLPVARWFLTLLTFSHVFSSWRRCLPSLHRVVAAAALSHCCVAS